MTQRIDNDEIERLVRGTYQATRIPPLSLPELPDAAPARTTRPRWLLPTATAAAVVVLLSGVALLVRSPGGAPDVMSVADSPSRGAAAGQSPTGTELSPAEQRLEDQMVKVIHRIDDLALAHDPAYDTSVFDVRLRTLTIYRADSVPGQQAALYQPLVPDGVTIRYAKALLSSKQRNELAAVVQGKEGGLRGQGIHLTGWGDEESPGGRFKIGYDPSFKKPSPADLTLFERFGAGTVVFVPEEPISVWGPTPVDR